MNQKKRKRNRTAAKMHEKGHKEKKRKEKQTISKSTLSVIWAKMRKAYDHLCGRFSKISLNIYVCCFRVYCVSLSLCLSLHPNFHTFPPYNWELHNFALVVKAHAIRSLRFFQINTMRTQVFRNRLFQHLYFRLIRGTVFSRIFIFTLLFDGLRREQHQRQSAHW